MIGGSRLLRWAEEGFALVALFICTEAIVPVVRREGGYDRDPIAGDPVMQVIWALLYLVALLLCSFRWRTTVRAAFRDRALLCLVGIAVLSVLWSAAPQVTLRRDVALLGTSLVGVLIGSRFTIAKQIELVAVALGVAAVLSVVFALTVPTYGLESGAYEGAWRGIYVQKNMLGQVMALEVLACLLVLLRRHHRRWLPIAGLLLSTTLLILSRSVTSMVMVVMVVAIIPFLRAWRWPNTLALPTFLAAAILGGTVLTLTVSRIEEVLGLIGRDATLTRRTEIWPAVLHSISEKPLLGFGYGGFWLGSQGESSSIASAVGWDVGSAHNGYLDLCLDLGVLGLVVYLAGFGISSAMAFIRFRKGNDVELLWPPLFLSFIFLYNFVESAILTRNSTLWVLYVSIVVSTSGSQILPTRSDSQR